MTDSREVMYLLPNGGCFMGYGWNLWTEDLCLRAPDHLSGEWSMSEYRATYLFPSIFLAACDRPWKDVPHT